MMATRNSRPAPARMGMKMLDCRIRAADTRDLISEALGPLILVLLRSGKRVGMTASGEAWAVDWQWKVVPFPAHTPITVLVSSQTHVDRGVAHRSIPDGLLGR